MSVNQSIHSSSRVEPSFPQQSADSPFLSKLGLARDSVSGQKSLTRPQIVGISLGLFAVLGVIISILLLQYQNVQLQQQISHYHQSSDAITQQIQTIRTSNYQRANYEHITHAAHEAKMVIRPDSIKDVSE